jgi:hypothetical protein
MPDATLFDTPTIATIEGPVAEQGPVPADLKCRESRLRRRAKRCGLRLMKSRSRNPNDASYGRYQVVTDVVLCGRQSRSTGYGANLDAIERFLVDYDD